MIEAVYTATTIVPSPGDDYILLETSWDPRAGRTSTYEWRGRRQEVLLLERQYINEGKRTSIQIPKDGGSWVLHVTVGLDPNEPQGPDTPLTDAWERDVNWLEKSMWEHPRIQAEFKKIFENDGMHRTVAIIKRDVEAFIRGDDKTTDINTVNNEEVDLTLEYLKKEISEAPGHGMDFAVFLEFIVDRLNGVEIFPVDSIVLRRTLTYAAGFDVSKLEENCGKQFSTDTLRSRESVPQDKALGELPDGFWLKKRPKTEQTAADKWKAVFEYWHSDTYSLFVYGNPV